MDGIVFLISVCIGIFIGALVGFLMVLSVYMLSAKASDTSKKRRGRKKKQQSTAEAEG